MGSEQDDYGGNYITSWASVPDGATVIEDTYNEVYTIFTRNGQRWLRHVGWQVPNKCGGSPITGVERLIDWDPQPYMDQPWIRLSK
jgi:hypothetical protein